MLCKKCQKELPEDSIFCQYCGLPVNERECSEINSVHIDGVDGATAISREAVSSTTQQKKKWNLSWLWITIIVFNCCAVIAGIIASVYALCYDICMRMVTTWRYINIDSSYQVGYSVDEYSNVISWIDEEILWLSITSIGIIFVFVALSILNSYICQKKLNIKRKKIRALPWLCTLIVMVLVCGGIALSSVFEYKNDIVYYQQEAEEERIEREKILAEEKEIQSQAAELLISTQEAMSPSEVWEYAQRYPDKSIGEMIKIKGYIGYINFNDSFFLCCDTRNVRLVYGNSDPNKPKLLDNDHVVLVGKITVVNDNDAISNLTLYERISLVEKYGISEPFVLIKIYDWEIID